MTVEKLRDEIMAAFGALGINAVICGQQGAARSALALAHDLAQRLIAGYSGLTCAWCKSYTIQRTGDDDADYKVMIEHAKTCRVHPAKKLADLETVIMAEYRYWRDCVEDVPESLEWMAAGAMGAASNILAAVHGHRTPWHREALLHVE